MAFRQAVVQHELPLVLGELQQSQLVGQCRLSHAKPLGCLRLRTVPQDHHIPQALRLLEGVQILPLKIFQKPHRRRLVIGIVAKDGRDGLHLCHLAGAEAPLPRHQLIAVFFFAHGYRLQ